MKNPTENLGFATRAIHAGQAPDPTTGAIMTPVYLTSTYVQESPGVHKGWEYTRTHNPTRRAYENCIASLESGKFGFAFASGCAATATVMHLLKGGDHVVGMDDMYGGTFRLFDKVLKHDGMEFSFVDLTQVENFEKAHPWISKGGFDRSRMQEIRKEILKVEGVLSFNVNPDNITTL
jgi:cystathionine gamma-lyase